MKLRVSNDIGNSETKMIIDEIAESQPSVIKRLIQKPSASDSNVEKNVINLLDQLMVHVTSNAIKRNGLFLVGKRANATADKVDNMNIKIGGKHKHDIPIVMTLAMVAAKAVQTEYSKTKELPTALDVTVTMTSAIPASEYTKEVAKMLEGRFTDHDHIVIVYVGEELVTIKLSFDKVKVTQEGIPPLFAILNGPEDMFEDFNKLYGEKYTYTADEFQDKKMLHLDIGDGTSEIIYTIGLNPVPDACTGHRRGVGHATEDAISLMKEALGGHLKINRQHFSQILKNESEDPERYEIAVKSMDEAKYIQAQAILEDVEEAFVENTASQAEIITVYGGGSIVFREDLYEELKDFAHAVKAKLLWIPEKYAVDMNRDGLEILNRDILFV